MKTLILLVASLPVYLGFFVPTADGADSPIPLHQAASDARVKLTVSSLGGATGDAILIVAQRQAKEVLRISLSPGTVFKSASGFAQSMVGATIKGERVTETTYRPSTEIVLEDDKEHTYIVEAYSIDIKKENPGTTDKFNITPPDDLAAQLIATAKLSKASPKVTQAALWMAKESIPAMELKMRFPITDDEVKAATTIIEEQRRLATEREAEEKRKINEVRMKHEIIAKADQDPKNVIKVQMLSKDAALLGSKELGTIATSVSEMPNALVWFYLPTMNTAKQPWAVVTRRGTKEPDARIFPERRPK